MSGNPDTALTARRGLGVPTVIVPPVTRPTRHQLGAVAPNFKANSTHLAAQPTWIAITL